MAKNRKKSSTRTKISDYERLYNSCLLFMLYEKIQHHWDLYDVSYLRSHLLLAQKLCPYMTEEEGLREVLSQGTMALYRLVELPKHLRDGAFMEWVKLKTALNYATDIINLFDRKEILSTIDSLRR